MPTSALKEIRFSGNDSPLSVWMQKVAAHGMDPKWPHPGEQPEGLPMEQLRKFLDVAAGEGYVFDGVDAQELYLRIFGEPK